MDDHALRADDVARILGVSVNLIYRLAKEGSIRSYHVGRKLRFSADDVERYILMSGSGMPKDRSPEDAISGNRSPEGAVPESHASKSAESKNRAPKNTASKNRLPESGPTALDDDGFLMQASEPRRGAHITLAGRGIACDLLADHLDGFGVDVARSYRDGYAALISTYLGHSDLAVVSLWDGSTGTCNVPFVKRLMPGTPCLVLSLGTVASGIVVRRGNPLGIRSWVDLLHKEVMLVNREPGSPQRILLDGHLIMLEAVPSRIAGYDRIAHSELALGDIVARGGADAGIATEDLFHRVDGLDYLPQQSDEMALVIRKSPQTEGLAGIVRDLLRSRNFQDLFIGAPGIDVRGMGRAVYEV